MAHICNFTRTKKNYSPEKAVEAALFKAVSSIGLSASFFSSIIRCKFSPTIDDRLEIELSALPSVELSIPIKNNKKITCLPYVASHIHMEHPPFYSRSWSKIERHV